jgi:hypothetical protein
MASWLPESFNLPHNLLTIEQYCCLEASYKWNAQGILFLNYRLLVGYILSLEACHVDFASPTAKPSVGGFAARRI